VIVSNEESAGAVDLKSPDDQEIWNVLLASRRRGAEEIRGLEQLLESWSRAHGDSGVAIYAPVKNGFRRLASVGTPAFPENLAEARGDDSKQLELPGGCLLLHHATEPVEGPCSPNHLLLASAASIIQLKSMRDEQNLFAMSQGVELVALYEVGLAIASILDLEKLAEEILSRAILLLDAQRGALYRLEDDTYRLTCARGQAEEKIDPTNLDFEALATDPDSSGSRLLPGASHIVAVPIESEGNRRGLLVVGSGEERDEGAFQAKDRRTLSLFANQAAIALETARLHKLSVEKQRTDRELEIAAEIQQQLLPTCMPQIPGFEVFGWNRPARVVGGDYFTFRDLGENHWALVIGDVSGKASPAALLVSTLDSALRVLLERTGIGPELVEHLNQHILESSSANRYVTMILTRLDPDGRLTYINAGHNPGVLIRGGDEVEYLESGGPPVGLLPNAPFVTNQVELSPGDLVCIYSDGITEAANRDEEEYELERFVALLQEHRASPLEEIADVINRTVTEFAEGLPQGDDQTVILLRRRTDGA
jgi:sigma-B regulation protein RsbU (phosphoserine phosphatase)